MPKVKRRRRIAVPFDEQQLQVIERLAALQGTSAAKVVGQFIEHVEPMLRDVVAALEAAAEAKGKPAAKLLAAMAELQTSVQGLTQTAVDQGDMFAGQLARAQKRVKRAEKPSGKRKRAKR